MKMQPDRLDGVNVISRFEAQRLWVHQTPFTHSVLVPHRGEVVAWRANAFDLLEAAHFEEIVALKPELVILGLGRRLRFPPAGLLRPLISGRVGYEVMDTAAACRTYNVLASEGRSVLAALLLEPGQA